MRRLVAYGLLGAVCAGTAIGWTLGVGLPVVAILLVLVTVACAAWWAVRVDEARTPRRTVAQRAAAVAAASAPTVLGADLVDLRANRTPVEEVGADPQAPVELPVAARVALPDALSA